MPVPWGCSTFLAKGGHMAKRTHMTWYAEARRWRKCVKGKWYAVSCKQLGVPETKEASWRAANEWWERQEGMVGDDGRVARATAISRLVLDFSNMDEGTRKEAVDALLGAGTYDG